ncbi:hypothetical protein QVD17_21767 [Tagetes erecta]|uniref:Uncharacterized protein n=1 Tax=Tagetes erecta TaxID=13708 RepID=A0AAD8KCB4_TARER|nr:hypothetical protein QVD17_21767 [Tagetes erecta]
MILHIRGEATLGPGVARATAQILAPRATAEFLSWLRHCSTSSLVIISENTGGVYPCRVMANNKNVDASKKMIWDSGGVH